jgi:N,N'-diacetyllegionaminate synthase
MNPAGAAFHIGERKVGAGEPVYIVAEAGSNHNGSFDQALRLIDVAVEAQADAVKFQTFRAAQLYPRSAGRSDYLKLDRSIYDIIESMEMPTEWIPRLAAHCQDKHIDFLSSPFDEESVDCIQPYVLAYKVASYELTHLPLVRYMARFGKPMIVSTGAATLEEVVQTVDAIIATGNDQIVLLQCTARYPAPLDALNIRAMLALREATGRQVGLSDHSRDPVVAPTVATALGGSVIEKHFTLSNRLPGPDHAFAIEPHELSLMVRTIRAVEQTLGDGLKRVLEPEMELREFARRSIFSTRALTAGEALTPDNIAVLRCGTLGFGLAPAAYPELIGRIVAHALPTDRLVHFEDLE